MDGSSVVADVKVWGGDEGVAEGRAGWVWGF